MKSKLFFCLRLIFVSALLVWLLSRMDLGRTAAIVRELGWHFLIPAFVFIVLESAVRSYNWMLLLRCKGACPRLGSVFYAYVVGSFLGTFIPSSMGVDLARFMVLSRSQKIRAQDAAVTVVALNVLSLLVLCVVVSLCAIMLSRKVDFPSTLYVLSAMALSVAVIFCTLYYFQHALRAWLPVVLSSRMGKIWALVDAFAVFQEHYGILRKVALLALCNLLLTSLTVYFISRALHVELSFIYFFALMPVITLSRLIPHSIAGVGGEQGIFVLLFSRFGVDGESAFLISLLLSSLMMLFVLSGGLFYVGGIVRDRLVKNANDSCKGR